MTTWSAPVRYAEVDGQGVVFNAHYLLYCDEAMGQFCRDRDLVEGFAERVRLVTTSLTWTSGARWGETVEVGVSCERVGRTSFTLAFDITADGRDSCRVQTTYVHVDDAARPAPIDDATRARLS